MSASRPLSACNPRRTRCAALVPPAPVRPARPPRPPRGEAGFSLIEIMVVVAIIGMLSAVVAPKLIERLRQSRVKTVKVDLRGFETGLDQFHLDNGFYPSTEQGLDSLVRPPTVGRQPKRYLPGGYVKHGIKLDPWGTEYQYVSPAADAPYEIWSYGADGVDGGEGYDADVGSWNLHLE